jgi:predicted lipoprotein with Yx(FWY)xxD motif
MAGPARRTLAGALAAGAVATGAVACGVAAAPAAGGSPAYQVQARLIPGAGRVLADGRGYTLYAYVPDHHGRSQCYGVCAQDWPPLTLPAGVARPRAGQGVRAPLLGTVRRAGGARQVTYHGWPLYLWQGDHRPGQATGQADDMGLWWVLSPSGAVDENQIAGAAAGG